jgi:hypothetical protein
MTIQDLMRHPSGLTYGLLGNSPIGQMYRKANIFSARSRPLASVWPSCDSDIASPDATC